MKVPGLFLCDAIAMNRTLFRKLLTLEIVTLLVLIPYHVCDPENRTATQHRNAAPPGASHSFVRLSDGVTHYDLGGPAGGAGVVFVSGMATPMFVWEHAFRTLAGAGYRVLRYDIYGRGYSDRPAVDHGPELYRRQLRELLAFAGPEFRAGRRVHVIALSMGGIIATDFADRTPERVRTLTLIAPAGFAVSLPAAAWVAKLPIVGDYFVKVFGHSIFLGRLHTNLYNQNRFEDYRERFAPQMYVYGTKAALLSSLRYMPLAGMRPAYERLGAANIPLLIVWGKQDEIISFETGLALRAALPRSTFLPVDAAGHIVHWEKAEAVHPTLLEFLRSY